MKKLIALGIVLLGCHAPSPSPDSNAIEALKKENKVALDSLQRQLDQNIQSLNDEVAKLQANAAKSDSDKEKHDQDLKKATSDIANINNNIRLACWDYGHWSGTPICHQLGY